MIVVDEEITQSALLLRYASGQRHFSSLNIIDDGSDALFGVNLDEIELVDSFFHASFRNASRKFDGSCATHAQREVYGRHLLT